MASIRIHQDIHNFEKKRNLFTSKQWAAIACAAVAGIGMAALNIYALRLVPEFGIVTGIIAVAPFVIVGFVPLQGMPSERFLEKRQEMNERGDALVWKGEAAPAVESELSNEYKRESGKRAYAGRTSTEIREAAALAEARSDGLPEFGRNPLLP